MAKITDPSKVIADASDLQIWLDTLGSLCAEGIKAAHDNSLSMPVLARGVEEVLSPANLDAIGRKLYFLLGSRESYSLTPRVNLNGGIPNLEALDEWYVNTLEQLSTAAATIAFRGNGHFRPDSTYIMDLRRLESNVTNAYRRLHTLIGNRPAVQVPVSGDVLLKYIQQ
ncbi:hypothetical protein HYT52_01010 [Candidatus Woesearchaeota archaeon]|nr:hypothetical protein [Candidatus Woesearchaeota archaeon]